MLFGTNPNAANSQSEAANDASLRATIKKPSIVKSDAKLCSSSNQPGVRSKIDAKRNGVPRVGLS